MRMPTASFSISTICLTKSGWRSATCEKPAISTNCRTSSRVYVSPSNLLWLLLVVALVVLLVGLFTGRQAV